MTQKSTNRTVAVEVASRRDGTRNVIGSIREFLLYWCHPGWGLLG